MILTNIQVSSQQPKKHYRFKNINFYIADTSVFRVSYSEAPDMNIGKRDMQSKVALFFNYTQKCVYFINTPTSNGRPECSFESMCDRKAFSEPSCGPLCGCVLRKQV
jgi:hypothetical protein